MSSSIYNMLQSLSSKFDNSEMLLVPFLVKKAENYLETNSHDKTVGIMMVALNKMLDNNKGMISRAELKDLYNKSYNYGTKASSLFSEEMNIKEEPVKKAASNWHSEELSVDCGDTILKTALSDVFAGREVREYSEDTANTVIKSIKATLNVWGLDPKNVYVSAGNDKVLIIKADYDTPKGITSVCIPVAIDDNKVVESGMFLGNSEPQEFSYNSLKNYIKSNAGVKLAFDSKYLLTTLTNKLFGDIKISSAEMALIKFKSKKHASTEYSQNSIVGLDLDAKPMQDVQYEKYADTDLFESKLSTSYGEAAFKFGLDTVKNAHDLVAQKLNKLGYKSANIKLFGFQKDSLQYAINLGTVAFTTSVKVNGKLVKEPSYLICNGSLVEFNTNSINELVNQSFDSKAAAIASPIFELSSGELLGVVEAAIKDNNLQKAEDALNVLFEGKNQVAYAKAMEIYLNGLNGKFASKSEHQCSKIIKHAHSNQMICSHTGLPISKVTSDKFGNCIPLYRKQMDDTFEGVVSLNSKVFI